MNVRLVSNPSFVLNITKKVILYQLLKHLSTHSNLKIGVCTALSY